MLDDDPASFLGRYLAQHEYQKIWAGMQHLVKDPVINARPQRPSAIGKSAAVPGAQERTRNVLIFRHPYRLVQQIQQSKTSLTQCIAYSSKGNQSIDAEALDFEQLELTCPINPDEISNRWLNPYLPIPGQKPKDYPPNVTSFIYRILKSYANIVIRGHTLQSLVHPTQLAVPSASHPLSACLRLVRIWDNPLPGSDSVADEVLQREMNKIHEQYRFYDGMNSLAAFQAYLILTMVTFFRSTQTSPFLRQAMTNLQEIACETCRRGIVCIAEQRNERPRWEAWVAAEAKRRTLFTMYMFDNVLSAHEGLPSYLGVELKGLPAPGSQTLWQARTRKEWERAYTVHLAEWLNGYLCIDELWPKPPGMDDSHTVERRRRVDHWLEGIDEYGTMLYAVTSQTHGD